MHELIVQTIFYVFAAVALIAAFMVIIQDNPVRSVLFLVLTFFASAVLWIIAEAEFLALILVLVYIGAVMTLFLFVVMMLNIDIESMKNHHKRYLPFALMLVALFTGLLVMAIPSGAFNDKVETLVLTVKSLPNTEALGMVLYTDYLLAFELAAVILLIAIIAAITLVHKGPRKSKTQDVKQQIQTTRNERVELINMKAEK